jgi:hypothetical protein
MTRNRTEILILSLPFLRLIDNGGWRSPELNPALHEARALLDGRIAITEPLLDTATVDGEIYNVFQPGQTLLFLAHLLVIPGQTVSVFAAEIFICFVLGFVVFVLALSRLGGNRSLVALMLAAAVFLGAPNVPSLPNAMGGSIYRANHCFALLPMVALLLVLSGRERRPWLAGACIAAAALFRAQNILLVFLPVAMWMQDDDGLVWRVRESLRASWFRPTMIRLFVLPVLAGLLIAGFQTARFGSPLESGYELIYDGRDDTLARRAHETGIFSIRYLPENLTRIVAPLPQLEFEGPRLTAIHGDTAGNSLLFTQPVLLLGLLLLPAFRVARVQALTGAAVLLALPVWLHHNPGIHGPGYARYALDYLPLWIATTAAMVRYGPRRPGLVAMVGVTCLWAVLYGGAMLAVPVRF